MRNHDTPHPDDRVEWAHNHMAEREELYNLFSMPHESFEDWVDRMSEDYGHRWFDKLKSKKR